MSDKCELSLESLAKDINGIVDKIAEVERAIAQLGEQLEKSDNAAEDMILDATKKIEDQLTALETRFDSHLHNIDGQFTDLPMCGEDSAPTEIPDKSDELPICEKCGEEFCGDGTSRVCFSCQPDEGEESEV